MPNNPVRTTLRSPVRGAFYTYAWGNNSRRAELRGRTCILIASGAMQTVLVEFIDTGERVTTSRRALRKVAVRCAAFIIVAPGGARRYCTAEGAHRTHSTLIGTKRWSWRATEDAA